MSATPSTSSPSLLSPTSRSVVQATAAVVAEHAEQITARFYARMFEEHPELLRVFNQGNQATGEQSRALAASVVAYAVQLIDPDAPSFDRVMHRIAYKHISLGIRPEQYTIVGHHLLAAVGEVLGDAVTPEIAAAWDEVYWLFATQLVAQEARLYQQAGVDPDAPGAAVPRGPADRGDRRRRVPGAGADRRRCAAGRSARGSTSRCSWTCRTAGASRASTRSPPRPSRPGCRSPCGGCTGSTAHRTAWSPPILHDHVAVGDVAGRQRAGRRLRRPGLGRARCCWRAPARGSPRSCRSWSTSPGRSRSARSSSRTPTGRRRTTRCARRSCTWAGRSTTSRPTPGTRASTPPTTAPRRATWTSRELPLEDDVQVFTCGPLPFMRHVRASLLARGVPASSIRYEVFGPDLWSPQD